MATVMHNILSRLFTAFDCPDYNYIIYSSSRDNFESPSLYWHLQIRPRTTTLAGFEIGSGAHINPSLPEKDAEILRSQKYTENMFEPEKETRVRDA